MPGGGDSDFYFDDDGIEVLDEREDSSEKTSGGKHVVNVAIGKKPVGAAPTKKKDSMLSRVGILGKAAKKFMGGKPDVPQRGRNYASFEQAAPQPGKEQVTEATPLPERPKRASADDDMLDIPAFLRRQSN